MVLSHRATVRFCYAATLKKRVGGTKPKVQVEAHLQKDDLVKHRGLIKKNIKPDEHFMTLISNGASRVILSCNMLCLPASDNLRKGELGFGS